MLALVPVLFLFVVVVVVVVVVVGGNTTVSNPLTEMGTGIRCRIAGDVHVWNDAKVKVKGSWGEKQLNLAEPYSIMNHDHLQWNCAWYGGDRIQVKIREPVQVRS